jgi:hypothetical protein
MTAETVPNQCLVIVFKPQLTLAFVDGHPTDELLLGGVRYRDAGYGEWTGFYDWLRDKKRRVIGVRYWLDDAPFLLDILDSFPYVAIPDNKFFVEVYFSKSRAVAKKESHDQDFLFDKIFIAGNGEFAIAFDTSLLTPDQVKDIRASAEACWVI